VLCCVVLCCVRCSGEDDELIQLQRFNAEKGDINSMINMGDLLYFGARGLARNQQEAYFWCVRVTAVCATCSCVSRSVTVPRRAALSCACAGATE
jgi:hypothetical protein